MGYFDTGSTLIGLFGIDPNMRLFSINPVTGITTIIGSLGVGDNGTLGLSTNSTTLYFTDAGILYTINTSTGAATAVGALGATNSIGALVFINGTLYARDNLLGVGATAQCGGHTRIWDAGAAGWQHGGVSRASATNEVSFRREEVKVSGGSAASCWRATARLSPSGRRHSAQPQSRSSPPVIA